MIQYYYIIVNSLFISFVGMYYAFIRVIFNKNLMLILYVEKSCLSYSYYYVQ